MRTRIRKTAPSAALALAALLAACAAPGPAPTPAPVQVAAEPAPDYVNAGIYEASDPSDPAARVALFLSPNHGFILRHTRDAENLVEFRGQWTSDPDSLRLSVWDVRRASASDSARRVERLDTTISCPIASGAAQPLPLLRLLSPMGSPRLITLAKPPETPAWDAPKPAKGKTGKKKKSRKPEPKTKTAKGRKDAPPAPPAATRTGA